MVGGKGGGHTESRNSEQVSLESLTEAGELHCSPDIFWELVQPLRCQNREEF